MILFLPAALSLRLRFGASDGTVCKEGADCCLVSAHRFRCASAIPFLLEALILRRLRVGGSVATALVRLTLHLALVSGFSDLTGSSGVSKPAIEPTSNSVSKLSALFGRDGLLRIESTWPCKRQTTE